MFISEAFAQAAPAATATDGPMGALGGLGGMLPLVLMFVVLYFVMIRPQMKRQKEHKAMIDALAKGDEVVTSGGVLGKVTKMGDTFVRRRDRQRRRDPGAALGRRPGAAQGHDQVTGSRARAARSAEAGTDESLSALEVRDPA